MIPLIPTEQSRIPFNKPSLVGNEFQYIGEALQAGHISGDGGFTMKCHSYLQASLGVPKALLTTNCTHALEMAALLLNLRPDDEVIIPSFTFVSTANAFVIHGAKPVFIDVRPDTLNLDERLLEAKITRNTRAIVPVHYAGVACEMDTIMRVAHSHGISVIEDNAHGLFARYKGQLTGTFGSLATQSFHETKNFTCGEGGALLINDPDLIDRAEIIREKGTNRSRFFRGQVDKYSWVEMGSSYLPSDVLAAFLYAQLEQRDTIQSNRRRVWEFYWHHLQDWAHDHATQLPIIPEHCEQPYHMFYILLPSLAVRQALIAHLKAHEIMAVFHYLPLHVSEMGRKLGGQTGDCPVTEDISDRLLRLPLYADLKDEDLARIVDTIKKFVFNP